MSQPIDQRLRQLADDGRALEHSVAATTLHPHSDASGRDASGTVRFEWVGDDEVVTIGEGWERAVTADDLSGAIAEAMTAALAARYADDGLRTGDEPVETPTAAPTAVDAHALAAEPGFAEALRRPGFRERLADVLAEAERRGRDRQSGAGPGRIVSVRLGHDGALVSMVVDPEQAHGRTGAQVSADAAAALRTARERFRSTDERLRPLTGADIVGLLNA